VSAYFLADDEIADLHRESASGTFGGALPLIIRGVQSTQLSIARYYGAITYNGQRYTYFAPGDELIRDDVLTWVKKRREAQRKSAADRATAAQVNLI
jgi:hypothetical protein